MAQQEVIELPNGWAKLTLKDIISISSGNSLTKSRMVEGKIPVFGGNGITGWHNDKNISKPTLIIGRVGFYCGSVYLSPEAAWVTDNAFITQFSEEHIDIHYLYWLLKFTDLRQNDSSTAQPVISGQKIYPIEIALPPLPEQKRIVEKLDSLLAQVDTIQQRLNNLPDIIKRFRQSVLAAAVSGKLTEQWRNENSSESLNQIEMDLDARFNFWLEAEKQKFLDKGKKFNPETVSKKYKKPEVPLNGYFEDIPEAWEKGAWGQVSNWITYGFTKPMPHFDEGIPIASAKSVRDGYMDLSKSNFTSQDAFEALSDKDRPRFGDILITKDGTIGRCCLVEVESDFCINQSVSVVQLRTTKVNRQFMLLCARSEPTQSFIRDHLKGTAIKHLSITDFAKCPLPLPTKEEQTEIVRLVEQYFALADTLEKNLANAKQRVDNLTQSILAKAFKGELVPQDPNDEPADKLLERIKAVRQEAEKLEKATKKVAKASKAKKK